MDRKEAMERMIGPVPSISIPFTQDGEVDYRGLADFVEFLVANKTSTLLITLADSLFSILSDDTKNGCVCPFCQGMRRGYGNHCARGLGAEQQ